MDWTVMSDFDLELHTLYILVLSTYSSYDVNHNALANK